MKDVIIAAAVLFVLWYAMSRGLFAQLGSGTAIQQQPQGNWWQSFVPQQSNWVNFETPWGNYAGGIQ